MEHLRNKSVLITGASRGIGAAVARTLAAHGAWVALAARDRSALEEVASELEADGGRALVVPCDVSDYASVRTAVEQAVEAFGGLDVLVNNAGLIDPIARITDSDPDAWSRVIDVNLKGVYYALQSALPHLIARRGTAIQMSSGAATSALEAWSHYCASKAAVLSLTRCAHREVSALGVRVVGLSPGTVATEMQAKIRASGINTVSQLDPSVHIPAEWVGRAVAYLCGPQGAEHAGGDFSLKDEEGRRRVGLPPLA